MCKLSLNIVPNVYNSLRSSFLSLAWPWPGRSLPKGNQWEWWDLQQGPFPGLGEVGHSPKGTSGSAGVLDWGPMWSGFQSTCHLQCTLHPQWPPMPPDIPTPQCSPWCHLYPCWPLSTYTPCQPPMHPFHPYTPWWPNAPNAPWHPLGAPSAPNTPAGPWAPPHPASPNTPWHLDTPWWTPMPLAPLQSLEPLNVPDAAYTPESIHFLPVPNAPLPAPWHPLHPC